MISDIQDILAIVRRLDAKRSDPPQPLSRQRDHDRDGDSPTRHSIPITAPKRDHRLHRQPQPHGWDWRSQKG